MAKVSAQSNIATPQPSGAGLTELWSRVKFLLLALVVFRIGSHIPVPGINPEQLAVLFKQQEGTILSFMNMFSGGSLSRMSIFALGIIPYISASIIMQLMSSVSPQLEQLKKEGETGRHKITQYTRYLTLVLAAVQAFGMSVALSREGSLVIYGHMQFLFIATSTLVTGTMFLMWLGEQITERGVGNGISMLIFASIVSGIPSALGQTFESAQNGSLNTLVLILVMVLLVVVVAAVVFMERGQRRITINYAQQQRGRQNHAAQQSFLPLKVNMAGVIPAIFASSLLLFPATLSQWFGGEDQSEWVQTFTLALSPGQPLYIVLFALGIVFFCYFYTALMFNPREVADNLKRSGALIPGIRPGEQTASYIDKVIGRLTLVGAAYMTAICLLPMGLNIWFNVPFYLGGTSLLIVVVVVMDLMAQIQSYLMSSQYEQLMKKANMKGSKSSALVR